MLDMDATQITKDLRVEEPFVLITYTTGFGEAPLTTLDFLQSNYTYLQGIAASGNKAWGTVYAKSADTISEMYGVPILLTFEMSGMPEDVETFRERVQNIRYETHRIEQRSNTIKGERLLQFREG